MKFRWIISVLLFANSNWLSAAPNIVDVVQSPAWLVRESKVSALRPGTEIIAGDTIRTGFGARVLLKLGEGSDVKLGASSRWSLESQTESSADRIFSAVMSIAKGAFRFTTTALSKEKKRNIKARLNTATIGIRGTDVWGRTDAEKTFVVLIEGNIEIERNDRVTEMSEPLSLYNAPNAEPADPLSTVSTEDLQIYAQETEPQAGQGVSLRAGGWRINLASYRNPDNARYLESALDEQGYPSSSETATIGGNHYTRVYIAGLASRADAQALGKKISADHSVSPWVTPE